MLVLTLTGRIRKGGRVVARVGEREKKVRERERQRKGLDKTERGKVRHLKQQEVDVGQVKDSNSQAVHVLELRGEEAHPIGDIVGCSTCGCLGTAVSTWTTPCEALRRFNSPNTIPRN